MCWQEQTHCSCQLFYKIINRKSQPVQNVDPRNTEVKPGSGSDEECRGGIFLHIKEFSGPCFHAEHSNFWLTKWCRLSTNGCRTSALEWWNQPEKKFVINSEMTLSFMYDIFEFDIMHIYLLHQIRFTWKPCKLCNRRVMVSVLCQIATKEDTYKLHSDCTEIPNFHNFHSLHCVNSCLSLSFYLIRALRVKNHFIVSPRFFMDHSAVNRLELCVGKTSPL